MLGRQERGQEWLFSVGRLRDLIPDDHILRRVDRVLDLSWLRDEVRELYDETNGRPGIDPEAAVRLMLAGFFHGIVQDRKLLREAQVNLAMRWFAGYQLHEELPDHSSLTRIRQRWGVARFRRIFERTVAQCAAHGLVSGETVHVDATLIRANASMESITRAHADAVWAAHVAVEPEPDPEPGGRPMPPRGGEGSAAPAGELRSRTDPDATLAQGSTGQPSRLRYKQHTAVDGKAQIVVDVQVTTGRAGEGQQLLSQLERIEARLGVHIGTVTADQQYGTTENYGALEARGTEALIPPQKTVIRSTRPIGEFKFDARHDLFTCPRGRKLRFRSHDELGRRVYCSKRRDCRGCPLAETCLGAMGVRALKIREGYAALLRARRRHLRREALDRMRLAEHRWQVEGVHGEEKEQHGLRRAARRGLGNMQIQAYLTAAVVNLKRLAGQPHQAIQSMARSRRSIGARVPFFAASARLAA
jgi:transposase